MERPRIVHYLLGIDKHAYRRVFTPLEGDTIAEYIRHLEEEKARFETMMDYVRCLEDEVKRLENEVEQLMGEGENGRAT